MITAEIINWTGKLIVAPRTRLADLLARDEAKRTGVYLLAGADPDRPGTSLVYVGEGDNVGARLQIHAADDGKDFFSRCCIVVSKDENYTKGHARYLEARLISLIRESNRARLDNQTSPSFDLLPEPEKADMEFVLEQLRIILPVLGFDLLEPAVAILRPTLDETKAPEQEPRFELSMAGTEAEAREHGEEFIVLQGSTARKQFTNTCPETYRLLREQLEKDGVLVDVGNGFSKFTRDQGFTTPTAAAAVIYGGAISGPLHWKLQGTQKSYGEWRKERLASVTAADET
jgi:hypothetical protein